MLLRPLTIVASLALVGAGAATACSVINSPDDPVPPAGTGGGTGATGGGAQGGSAGSGGTPCPGSEVLCDDSCVDPLTDDAYCGASGDCTGDNAGMECPSHAPCADGECGTPFPISLFPIGVPGTTGGYSDLVLDPDGNLLVPTQDSRTIIRVDRTDGSTDAFALGIGTSGIIVAVAYDTVRDQIYTAGTSGSTNQGPIYSVDPDSGASQDLTTLTNRITSLSVAPAGFGAYGGHVIASTSVGEIIAIDPDDATTPVTIATLTAWVGDTAFTADATLYVAGDPPVDVSTVAAGGTVTAFATGFSSADGLVIDEVGNRMFVADSGADKLYSVTMPGGTLTDLGDYDFDDGFFASGLAYDGVYTVIMATGEAGGLTLQAHSLQ